MTTKTLRSLFDAMHHGKHRFEEFLNLDVASNCERIEWTNRIIYRPSKTLKTFQTFLNTILFEQLPVNERVVFAYRKGVTQRDAVAVHATSSALYQTDFSNFFHSLKADLVRQTISVAETSVSDLTEHLDQIVALTTLEGRLPIGFVTSPSISNACLKSFDDALEFECERRGAKYSRYADDIFISAPSRQHLDGIGTVVRGLAHRHINPELETSRAKTKLTSTGRRIHLLGMDILPSGRVITSRELRHKIEYSIHFLITDRVKFEAIHAGDGEKGLVQLQGFIGHVHATDKLYLDKLRKKFGATVIDALLHRSFRYESN